MWTDGHTQYGQKDRPEEAKSRFSQFCESAPKLAYYFSACFNYLKNFVTLRLHCLIKIVIFAQHAVL